MSMIERTMLRLVNGLEQMQDNRTIVPFFHDNPSWWRFCASRTSVAPFFLPQYYLFRVRS